MKQATTLLSLLLALLLVGCSGSRPATTSAPSAPDTTTASSADRTEPPSTDAADEESTPAPAPSAAPQDWFHLDQVPRSGPGLDTRAAYRSVLNGRAPRDTVRVAILDSGVDIDHEDLAGAAWTNADEVPNNGVDDDNNGYVDDVHGWNFIGGPDGQNVNQDTYELTRIFVDLRERFRGVDSAAVAPEDRPQYQRYQEIKRTFREKRQQAQKRLRRVKQAQTAVETSVQVLKNHLQADTLTQASVRGVSSPNQDVRRAKKTLQYFYDQGLTPSDLRTYRDQLQRQVEYNYNPDFNPRPVVGDDYPDKAERYYGNNDVTGPDASHGTHVAGIVGASRANEIGIDGIARGVRLMSVRTVPNGDERDKDVANAIRYAVENGADVINISIYSTLLPPNSVHRAIKEARRKNVLVVGITGNGGSEVDFFGQWEEVLTIGAVDQQRKVWNYSNHGSEVDLVGPGVNISSLVPGGKIVKKSGTSFAAAHVTGVASLVISAHPGVSAAELSSLLKKSATDLLSPGYDPQTGYGLVNAKKAMDLLDN